MKANFKSIAMLIVIVLAVIIGVSYFSKEKEAKDEFVYSDLIQLLEDDMVTSFVVDENNVITVKAYKYTKAEDGSLVIETKDGKNVTVEYEYTFSYLAQVEEILALAKDRKTNGTTLTEYNVKSAPETPWYVLYLPYILVGLLVIGLWIFMMRQASQGGGSGNPRSFAKSKAKVAVNDKNSVKFKY